MKESKNWFTKFAIAPVLLLLVAGCLVGGAVMTYGGVSRNDVVDPAALEKRDDSADRPGASTLYRLIPRAADIAHETRVAESGNGTKRVTRASVNFNPRSFVLYTVLVWQDVKTEVNGEPVDMRIYYDAVPAHTSLTPWRSH